MSDLERSVKFWRDVVGLHPLKTATEATPLGVDDTPLVVLRQSATRPVQRGYSGLFHVAINLPSEPELARVLARVSSSGYRVGASDHMVAKSIYLNDPDGIGLEITFETPERVRSFQWDEGSSGPLVIDAEGRRRHGVEALDIDGLLSKLPDKDSRDHCLRARRLDICNSKSGISKPHIASTVTRSAWSPACMRHGPAMETWVQADVSPTASLSTLGKERGYRRDHPKWQGCAAARSISNRPNIWRKRSPESATLKCMVVGTAATRMGTRS